jgi:DNA-binding Xre family transcriptional regulator
MKMKTLKDAIEKTGRTQKDIAEQAGISEDTLSRLVQNGDALRKAKYETVIDLCNTLNCTPRDIGDLYYVKGQEYDAEQRIKEMTIKTLPIFSKNETMYLVDVLNSSMYTPGQDPVHYLRIEIVDGNECEGLGEKWEVDVQNFERKIAQLAPYQAWVIICKVRAWWDSPEKDRNKIW